MTINITIPLAVSKATLTAKWKGNSSLDLCNLSYKLPPLINFVTITRFLVETVQAPRNGIRFSCLRKLIKY